MKKILPWILILCGFLLLNMLPPVIGGGCMVLGITMLLNKIWLEEWPEQTK